MNILDIIIFAIIALCAFIGFRKGLIRTLYRLISFFAAVIIARQLYPYVARWLRGTALFPTLRDSISNALDLDALIYETVAPRTAEVIDNLPLPQTIQNLLHNNYTPAMREVLQASTIEDYIAGFFASMIINGIAIVVVFVLAMILLALVGSLLDIVSRLPVIRTFNRIGGFLFGLLIGSIFVWVALIIVLFALAANPTVSELIEGSWVVHRLFESSVQRLAEV